MSAAVAVALGLAFVSATALWWLYFGDVAGSVVERLSSSSAEEAGRIGRDVYTYLHIPIVVGIVLAAVGDELVIAHPGYPMHLAGALATLAGPAIYLIGMMACAARVGRPHSWARTVATVLLIAAVPVAASASGLLVAGFVAVVLTTLVVVEQLGRGSSSS
jgi:low temperature requirement protein LtrA